MPTPGTQVGSTTASHAASGNLTATLPQAATAGDLLLIVVAGHSGSSSLTPSITTPAGLTRVGGTTTTSTTSDKTISASYFKVAAGGETSVTFTLTNCGAGSSSVATEWAGPIAAPLDQNGTAATSGASSTGRTDTSTAIIDVGPIDLNFGVHVGLSVAATGTPTSSWGTGLTGLYVDPWTNQLSIDIAVSTSTGATTVTPSDTWSANGAVLGTIMKSFSFFLTPTGTGSLTLAASGTAAGAGSASGSLTLGASATDAAAGAATAGLSLGASGTAVAAAPAATGGLSLSASASAAAQVAGSASLSLDATAAAQTPAAGTASITLTSSGSLVAQASASATITLGSVSTAQASDTASAALTLTASASRPTITIHGTAVAAWGELAIDAAGTDYKEGVVSITWGALTIIADNSPQDHDGILVCAWGE